MSMNAPPCPGESLEVHGSSAMGPAQDAAVDPVEVCVGYNL